MCFEFTFNSTFISFCFSTYFFFHLFFSYNISAIKFSMSFVVWIENFKFCKMNTHTPTHTYMQQTHSQTPWRTSIVYETKGQPNVFFPLSNLSLCRCTFFLYLMSFKYFFDAFYFIFFFYFFFFISSGYFPLCAVHTA